MDNFDFDSPFSAPPTLPLTVVDEDPFGRNCPNRSRLTLHEALKNRDHSERVPHSFDSTALLDHAVDFSSSNPDPELRVLTARALSLHGRADEASSLLSTALSDPDLLEREKTTRALYLHERGRVLARVNDLAGAINCFHDALDATQRNRRRRAHVLVSLADCELRAHSIPSSERSYRAALDVNVQEVQPLAYFGLARAARLLHQHDDARAYLSRAETGFAERKSARDVRAVRTERASMHVDENQPDDALRMLDAIGEQSHQLLDVFHLGVIHYLRARARELKGDDEAALQDAAETIRCFEAGAYPRHSTLALLRYSRLCVRVERPDGATWAAQRAMHTARDAADPQSEFAVLSYAVYAMSHGTDLGFDGIELAKRAQEIFASDGKRLSRENLFAYASGLPGLTFEGAQKGSQRNNSWRSYEPPPPLNLREQLQSHLGEIATGHDAPEAPRMASFLYQFTGRYLKSSNYTREFGLTQERAKRHLRALCTAGVLERHGARKASRYAIAFHCRPATVESSD